MSDKRTISITLDLNARTFQRSLDSAAGRISRWSSQARSSLNRVGSAVNLLRSRFVALAGGITFGLAAGMIIRKSAEYEAALGDMRKVTDDSFGNIHRRISSVSSALGDYVSLVRGYYQTISSGVTHPVKAIELLTVASKAARGSGEEQGEVIKGLTKLMAGYTGEIESVTDASDLLFTIERVGQTNFRELIPLVGGLASQSKALAVNATEMGGALALLTQTSGSTAEAATKYQAVLTALTKPSERMIDILRQMGVESGEQAIAQFGLVEVLRTIERASGGTSRGLGEILGRKEAILGFLGLASNGFRELEGRIQSVASRAGATESAFENWRSSMQGTWETFKATLTNRAIEIGDRILPMLTSVLNDAIRWMETRQDSIHRFFDAFGDGVLKALPLVGALSAAIGTLVHLAGSAAGGLAQIFTGFEQIVAERRQKLFSNLGVNVDVRMEKSRTIEGLRELRTELARELERHQIIDHSRGILYGMGPDEYGAVMQEYVEMTRSHLTAIDELLSEHDRKRRERDNAMAARARIGMSVKGPGGFEFLDEVATDTSELRRRILDDMKSLTNQEVSAANAFKDASERLQSLIDATPDPLRAFDTGGEMRKKVEEFTEYLKSKAAEWRDTYRATSEETLEDWVNPFQIPTDIEVDETPLPPGIDPKVLALLIAETNILKAKGRQREIAEAKAAYEIDVANWREALGERAEEYDEFIEYLRVRREELDRQIGRLEGNFRQGLSEGFEEMIENLGNDYQHGKALILDTFAIIDRGTMDLYDRIVDGSMSAKQAFSAMVRSMIADLGRLAAEIIKRKVLTMIFSSLLSGAAGAGDSATGTGAASPSGDTGPGMYGGGSYNGYSFLNAGPVPSLSGMTPGTTVIQNTFEIHAMDGADVQRVLVKNRGTIEGIMQDAAARKPAVRKAFAVK